MTADPAIAAAQRAWVERYDDRMVTVEDSARHDGVGSLAIAAAREALAPLRKLHENWSAVWETPPRWDEDGNAHHAVTLLLQELAQHLYPKDEL